MERACVRTMFHEASNCLDDVLVFASLPQSHNTVEEYHCFHLSGTFCSKQQPKHCSNSGENPLREKSGTPYAFGNVIRLKNR